MMSIVLIRLNRITVSRHIIQYFVTGYKNTTRMHQMLQKSQISHCIVLIKSNHLRANVYKCNKPIEKNVISAK